VGVLKQKHETVKHRPAPFRAAHHQLAIAATDDGHWKEREVSRDIDRGAVQLELPFHWWTDLDELRESADSTAREDGAYNPVGGLAVADEAARGRFPEGAEISENRHRLEKTGLTHSILTEDQVDSLAEDEFVDTQVAKSFDREIDQLHPTTS
jgi:hypothetical protein